MGVRDWEMLQKAGPKPLIEPETLKTDTHWIRVAMSPRIIFKIAAHTPSARSRLIQKPGVDSRIMGTLNDESVRRLLRHSDVLRRVAKHVNMQWDEVTDRLHAVLARDQPSSPDQFQVDEFEADSRRLSVQHLL